MVECASNEEHSEPVMVGVSETTGDSSVEFDEIIDGLCRCLGYAEFMSVYACRIEVLFWIVGIIIECRAR